MLVDFVREQSKSDKVFVVIINCNYDQGMIGKIPDGVELRLIERKPASRNPFFLLRLIKVITDIDPDIIHCHNADIFPLVPYWFRKRMLVTVHACELPIKHIRRFRKKVAISKTVADDLIKRGGVVSDVVLNGVNFSAIRRKRQNLASLKKENRAVIVGRLVHEIKGQDLAIRALKAVVKRIEDATLCIIGGGPSEPYLKNLACEEGICESVVFLGMKDRNWIYDHLANYDLLLQPSRREGFGLTVVEGIAAGLEVLVSSGEGPEEICRTLDYGLIFINGNVEDLAERWIMALQRPVRDTPDLSRYSVGTMVKGYREVYGELL